MLLLLVLELGETRSSYIQNRISQQYMLSKIIQDISLVHNCLFLNIFPTWNHFPITDTFIIVFMYLFIFIYGHHASSRAGYQRLGL